MAKKKNLSAEQILAALEAGGSTESVNPLRVLWRWRQTLNGWLLCVLRGVKWWTSIPSLTPSLIMTPQQM